ncbi:thiol-disulfide oxidoreductase DCC family protein [Comamonas odontotermitis]|uniref:thiol-disulfide oxidoreductase DCC family protein n=1 Tax=Comamonas odontotermitis TaxID=379895 RepID=UPI001CC5B90E|nr:DUF393 domain-containing protein [Comamonas odontotermitis]UBB16241.1 DUF393 domain-containing protein [Comamonas odontotermitis]
MPASASAPTQFPLTIYYDASCRMCNAEMTNLMLRNDAGRLIFVDASSADLRDAPATKDALMRAIHGVAADGRVYIGVDCLVRAYLGIGWAWVPNLVNLPGMATAARKLYPWIARNRYRLPQTPIVWVFERAMRRAAQRAATRSAACAGGTCDTDRPQH